jgi:hypothetical protein
MTKDEALKLALAAPVQEPWGFHIQFNNGKDATFKGLNHLAECEAHLESGETITMIYTTPPAAQRQWVGLTHAEYGYICDKHSAMSDFDFLEDIETKLREKNAAAQPKQEEDLYDLAVKADNWGQP